LKPGRKEWWMLMQRPARNADSSSTGSACSGRARRDRRALLDDGADRGLLLRLRLAGHRQIVERDVAEIEMRVGFARIVGDDSGDLHVEFADAPAIEQIGEAMVEARDEQQHAQLLRARAHPPVHAEGCGDRAEAFGQRLHPGALAEAEDDAHEEAAGDLVVELVGFGDVGAAGEQMLRHGGDDAGPVRTGEGENVGVRHARAPLRAFA
jgi:hypothetical protein